MSLHKGRTRSSMPYSTNLLNRMQDWERMEEIKHNTSLVGRWEEVQVQCIHCNSAQYMYIYEDKKTVYCLACDQEFDVSDFLDENVEIVYEPEDAGEIVTNEIDLLNEALKKLDERKENPNQEYVDDKAFGYGRYKTYQGYDWTKNCAHPAKLIIQDDGAEVWAGRKLDIKSRLGEFDLLLNLTYTSVEYQHDIPIPELEKYKSVHKFKEIRIDWADYGVTDLPRGFWVDLIEYVKTNKFKLLVFCEGGHGRTGTALAILLCNWLGYEPRQAMTWIRNSYCDQAIETITQEDYVKVMSGLYSYTKPVPVQNSSPKTLTAGEVS